MQVDMHITGKDNHVLAIDLGTSGPKAAVVSQSVPARSSNPIA